MNQENDHNVSQMRERYLWGADAESRLKEGIQKVEADLKERIQKVEADLKEDIQDLKEDIQKTEENFMNAIQEVKDNHKRLVSRIFWAVGIIFTGAVAIAVALISRG